ncbi:MAG: hypothetical protein GY925_11090 [Actinomycetia bacterium]|nr:hypothetical protein [Actinomycetes bacterium]
MNHPGERLRSYGPLATWVLVAGPYEVPTSPDDSTTILTGSVDAELSMLDGSVGEDGLRGMLSRGVGSESLRVAIPNLIARNWPADGIALVGVIDGDLAFGFSLYAEGIASIGHCGAGFSLTWNEAVGRGNFEDHLDALELLLADPNDPRLEEALGFATDSRQVTTEWTDREPRSRSYDDAPTAVLARLQFVDIVVFSPAEWQGVDEGGVCSRTDEALTDCTGWSVTETLTNGEPGWLQTVAVAPNQPVTIFLLGDGGKTLDLIEIDHDLLVGTIDDDPDLSVFVDLRPLCDSQRTLEAVMAGAGQIDSIRSGIVPTPDPVTTPPAEDEGP